MSLAIVGAGPAGLAAAWALRTAPFPVTVFEKSRGLAGRAATRRRETPEGLWRYDHGANYVKAPVDSPVRALFADGPLAEGAVDLARPVWTFDAEARVAPGDPARDAGGKWTYPEGISALGRRLAEAAGTTVRTSTRIERLELRPDGWLLHAEDGAHGPFHAVLLTAPAPQSADLLAASSFDADRRALLVDALRQATYRRQFALVLAFARPLDRPGDAYAFVNPDGEHDVAWLAFEEDKPGRVPPGRGLIVAQMAPGWTRRHYALEHADLVAAARPALEHVLGGRLPEPLWTDHQRWRFALPERSAEPEPLAEAADLGLFFAGDFVPGEGRVHRALEAGLRAADAVRHHLVFPVATG